MIKEKLEVSLRNLKYYDEKYSYEILSKEILLVDKTGKLSKLKQR